MATGIGVGIAGDTFQEKAGVGMGPDAFSNLYSVLFDGVDEYLESSSLAPDFGTGNWSINFWIYRTSTGGAQRILSKSGGSDSIISILVTNAGAMQFISGLWNDGDGTNTPGTNTWEMWTYSVDRSGDAIWYKNGASPNAKAVSAISGSFGGGSGTIFRFGRNEASSYNFAGNLDEISVWSKALSALEVADLYNSGKPTDLTSQAGLINWFRMGDPEGPSAYPTITDSVGGINMTMTNMSSANITTNVP